MKCGACSKEHASKSCPQCEGRRNRDRHDQLTLVVRELKSSVNEPLDAQRERELVLDLDALGHPDKDSLLRWITEQKTKPAQQPQRGKYQR